MLLRHSIASLLALCLLVPVAARADAARPAATRVAPSGPVRPVAPGLALVPDAAGMCLIGVNDPHFPMNYLYPPDDEYYTLVDPDACECAGETGLGVSVAHVVLDFPEACTIPVTVAIVAADVSNPSCPAPVRGAYLCAPVDHEITVGEGGAYDVSLPLPATCTITQPAFLLVTFREVGDCGTVPSLYVSFGCSPCTSWNYWPGGPLLDLCDGYLLGNPNMYVSGSCLGVVPNAARSWGGLKSFYR